MPVSRYLNRKLLEAVFEEALGGSALSIPGTSVWAALSTGREPGEGGDTYVEISGGGYSRVKLTTSNCELQAYGLSSGLNAQKYRLRGTADFLFGTPTSQWLTPREVLLLTDDNAGELLARTNVSPQAPTIGASFSIPAGLLTFDFLLGDL